MERSFGDKVCIEFELSVGWCIGNVAIDELGEKPEWEKCQGETYFSLCYGEQTENEIVITVNYLQAYQGEGDRLGMRRAEYFCAGLCATNSSSAYLP